MLIGMPPLPQGSEANNNLLPGLVIEHLLLNGEAAGQASLETTPETEPEGHCYAKGSGKQSPTVTRDGCRGDEKPSTEHMAVPHTPIGKAEHSELPSAPTHQESHFQQHSNTALIKQSSLCSQEMALRSKSSIQAQGRDNKSPRRSQ